MNFTTTHLFAHLIDRDPFLYLYRIPVSTTIPASLLRDSRNNNKIVQRYFFCTINIPSLFLTRSIEGTPFSPPLRSMDQRCTRAEQSRSSAKRENRSNSVYLSRGSSTMDESWKLRSSKLRRFTRAKDRRKVERGGAWRKILVDGERSRRERNAKGMEEERGCAARRRFPREVIKIFTSRFRVRGHERETWWGGVVE